MQVGLLEAVLCACKREGEGGGADETNFGKGFLGFHLRSFLRGVGLIGVAKAVDGGVSWLERKCKQRLGLVADQ